MERVLSADDSSKWEVSNLAQSVHLFGGLFVCNTFFSLFRYSTGS